MARKAFGEVGAIFKKAAFGRAPNKTVWEHYGHRVAAVQERTKKAILGCKNQVSPFLFHRYTL